MSATPLTDKAAYYPPDHKLHGNFAARLNLMTHFARRLELELNEVKQERDDLRRRAVRALSADALRGGRGW